MGDCPLSSPLLLSQFSFLHEQVHMCTCCTHEVDVFCFYNSNITASNHIHLPFHLMTFVPNLLLRMEQGEGGSAIVRPTSGSPLSYFLLIYCHQPKYTYRIPGCLQKKTLFPAHDSRLIFIGGGLNTTFHTDHKITTVKWGS